MKKGNINNIVLFKGLRSGDEAIFSKIYQLFHNAVFTNICKLVKNNTEAEDLLQETFVQLWNSRYKLTENQDIGGWLFLTSYYKSLEWLKANIRREWTPLSNLDQLEDEYLPDTELAFQEKLNILHAAIEQLPPQKKSAFTLCRLQGKTYREAAIEMGISEETVKDYIKSSLKFIRGKAQASGYSIGVYMICLLAAATRYL